MSSIVDDFKARPLLFTMGICVTAGILGHAILWVADAVGWLESGAVTWQPVTGISLVIISFTAFGGFYYASRRARVAIASSFLLTFLVSLSYAITLAGFGEALNSDAKDIFTDFRYAVTLIIGFYFGSEAAIGVAQAIGVAKTQGSTPADVRRAGRDLVTPQAPDESP
ncbi:hypothetical protein [Streptomyces chartreusis]